MNRKPRRIAQVRPRPIGAVSGRMIDALQNTFRKEDHHKNCEAWITGDADFCSCADRFNDAQGDR